MAGKEYRKGKKRQHLVCCIINWTALCKQKHVKVLRHAAEKKRNRQIVGLGVGGGKLKKTHGAMGFFSERRCF